MAAPDVGIPAEAMARFTAAEARLYPMVMVDPVGYQQATALVGLVVGELRASCFDIVAVLGRRNELIARLPDIAATATLDLAGLPVEAVVDAASAVLCRELQRAGAAAARRARIEAARAAGDEWFVDEPDPMAVMSGSYRRVELHLPSGSSVISSIEAGGARSGATYSVELDRRGEQEPPMSLRRRVYQNREAWEAGVADLRAELSGSS